MVIQFSRAGISWFATQQLVEEPDEGVWDARAAALVADAENALSNGPTLRLLDLADLEVQQTIAQRVTEHGTPTEKAALIVLQAANMVRRDVPDDSGCRSAATAGYFLAQARSLLVFERQFADVTFAGHESNAHFIRAIQFWNSSREADEATWQGFLTERPWLLSVLAASPVVLVQDRAYIGGKSIDDRGGSVVDYLVQNAVTLNTSLIEIKTPKAPLLGTEYRTNVFAPSAELAGAVQQLANYRQHLIQKYDSLRGEQDCEYRAWNPAAILVVGNAESLDTDAKRRSFELYRSELRHIRVVAYDELFAAVRAFAQALGFAVGSR